MHVKITVQSVFMRNDIPATATQCDVFTDFLCDQLKAYMGDRDALQNAYIYVLVHDRHTYIGRCDCLRKSKTWGGGPAHRFQEHVRCQLKHKNGTIGEKQRRTRYMLLAQSCNIVCPILVVIDKVHQSISAATEITYINMFRPSCNHLQKTFGVKSQKDFSMHLHKLHKQGHSRHRNNTRLRIMSQFAASQNPVNLYPVVSYPESSTMLSSSNGQHPERNGKLSFSFSSDKCPRRSGELPFVSSHNTEERQHLPSPPDQHYLHNSSISQMQSSSARTDALRQKQLIAGRRAYERSVREHNEKIDL